MSSIHELYGRFRHLIHEGAKFLVVGGIGSVVTIGGAFAMQGIGKYKAVTIATIVATFVTFLGNRHWTFRHRQGSGAGRETAMFFFLNGVGLLIYYACIWLVLDVAGLNKPYKLWYVIALVVGTGLGTLFRFWSYRRWIWKLVDRSPGSAQAAPSRAGPGRLGPAITRRPQGRHAANGHGHAPVGPGQRESLPDPEEISETSAWPR